MTATLALSTDELLSTTRAVRKRLDLDRPVPMELVRECVELALQAPSGSNLEPWSFVVVTDPDRRRALADVYRKALDVYRELPTSADKVTKDDPELEASQRRIMESVEYLGEHLHEVPVLVVPCLANWPAAGPMDRLMDSVMYGSVMPAMWSFCLAARSRGLGTAWTSMHLICEQEAAEVLGVPDTMRQVGLLPVAFTKGDRFRPAPRRSVDEAIHLDAFDGSRAPTL
jgi:nitroreductase